MPLIGNAQLKLLERLSNASAVSGDEGEVRQIVLEAVRPLCDTVKVDALGNVLAVRQAATRRPGGKAPLKVMLTAHMDEIGFMLVAEDGEGLYRFETVGGIDLRQLVGKSVLVGREHKPGVIGARPIHLTSPEDRRRTIALDTLRIDLGTGGKAAPGERAVFATRYQRSGDLLFCKAIDDRIGVATLIELLKAPPAQIDLLVAFTVQEENGLRGAKVAAHALDPDVGIAVDSTPALDLPAWDGEENVAYNVHLGQGPAIYIADGSTLCDPRLVRFFHATAEAEKIPCQFRQPGGGGTDAGAIHKARAGIPSLSISVPHRYGHTAVSLARLDDWKNTLALLHAGLQRLTPAVLAGERR